MDAGTGTKVTHILLLEDDKAHQELILRMFRDDPEQFRISVAGTVREAREIIGREHPDLIIADWILPDGKGIEILPRMDELVTTPLIIMTSYGDEHLAVEIMKSGAIDYIVKSATTFKDMPRIARRAIREWENITERKRAEKEKWDSEKRLADIISFLPDAVVAIDNEGRVIAWNDATEQMTGVAAEEMLGKGDFEYSIPFYGERRPILIDLIRIEDKDIEQKYLNLQREGERISSEVYIPTLFGGKGAYLWGTASPLYDSTGNRIGAIEIIRDITDRKRAEQFVQESERKYRFLIDNVRDIVWQTTPDLTFNYVSPVAETLTGYPPADLIGTSLLGILTESSARAVQERLGKRMEEYSHGNRDIATVFEIEITHKNGCTHWFEVSANAIFGPGGSLDGFQGVSRDISERKRADTALIESEVRFRDLINNMSAGVVIYEGTPDGNDFIIRDINRAVETIEQVKKDEIIGKSVLKAFPGVVEFGLFAVFQRVAKTGIPESHPVSLYRDDRISGWRDNYIYKLPSGEVIALYEDVTKKKQAEEETQRLLIAVEEEKEKLSSLINSITDEVWFTDTQHRFTLANPPALKEFGLDHPGETDVENIVKNLEVLRPDGTPRPLEEAPPLRALAGETVNNMEEIVRTPARGELRYRQVSAAPVKDHFGTIIGAVSVVRDITEQNRVQEALRESELRYRSVIENAVEGITVVQDGKLQYANPRLLEMTQVSPEEFTYRPFTDFIHPDDRALVFERYQHRISGEDVPPYYDFRVIGKNGKVIWVQISAVRIIWGGNPATLNFLTDITDRKQTEEQINKTLLQLERSEALLRKVYDILPIGLWLADKNGKIFYGNPAGIKIWGADPHVPIERYRAFKARRLPSGEEIAPDDWALGHTIHEGVTIKDEMIEIDTFDGKKKIILNYTAPLYDTTGAIDGAIVVNQEITGKVKAEKALQENQARLSTAMDIAGLVNWEYDVASGMFTFDERFYAFLETTADREGGNLMSAETYMQEFVYPDDRPAVLAEIQKLVAATDPAYSGQMEHRITPRDGSVRTIIARFAPIMGPDGKVIRTYGANQDITDRKLMESEICSLNVVLEQRVKDRTEALVETNDKLEEENAQRLEAERKLQASYDEKVMLLKEIHHRVKNNLQIIASLLNLQSRYIKDEPTLAAIRESQNRVKAMALVHEKLYRSEDISHISLQDYIKFLGTGLFHFYDAKLRGIQFNLDIHDIEVDIDTAIPLGLIINELISNSLKYAFPEGKTGEVAISVRKADRTLTVLFRDTGIGIPPDLDWRNTPSLGLRLVITLIDQMNGTIELDRSTGTLFTMIVLEKEPRSEK